MRCPTRLVGMRYQLLLAVLAAACGVHAVTDTSSTDNTQVSSTSLPLGDGHVSSSPRVGYVYSCQTSFSQSGASVVGPWISGSSWDPSKKPEVSGSVSWPDAQITVSIENGKRVVRANNLPKHTTGVFPVQQSDVAYQYDRNPNSIRTQTILLSLPVTPSAAATPSCTSFGMVGFALSGAAIYNALDAGGNDAVAHEIQDHCSGHPQQAGQYHYHSLSACFTDKGNGAHSELVGYARDGYGIYGSYGEGGKKLRNEDLDVCHGHEHSITWDGATVVMYHYHTTAEYPYTIGCYHASTSSTN